MKGRKDIDRVIESYIEFLKLYSTKNIKCWVLNLYKQNSKHANNIPFCYTTSPCFFELIVRWSAWTLGLSLEITPSVWRCQRRNIFKNLSCSVLRWWWDFWFSVFFFECLLFCFMQMIYFFWLNMFFDSHFFARVWQKWSSRVWWDLRFLRKINFCDSGSWKFWQQIAEVVIFDHMTRKKSWVASTSIVFLCMRLEDLLGLG